MRNQKGFSTLEILISVGFLGGLILVCSHIFKKQQVEMINVIQKIEITSTVNEIRAALKDGDACTSSFENKKIGSRDIKVIKKIVQFPNTDEIEEIDAFPLFQYGRVSFGEHKLKISDYLIEPFSDSVMKTKTKPLYLSITFDKGIPSIGSRNIEVRNIKFYGTTDKVGRIESCSLNNSADGDSPFFEVEGESVKGSGFIGIGTNFIPSALSISGGIQFQEILTKDCNQTNNGVIFRFEDELYFCFNKKPHQMTNLVVKGL